MKQIIAINVGTVKRMDWLLVIHLLCPTSPAKQGAIVLATIKTRGFNPLSNPYVFLWVENIDFE